MKILHLSWTDLSGGAARAAYRINAGLRRNHIDSSMLVQYKSSTESFILGPNSALEKLYLRMNARLDKLPLKLYRDRQASQYHLQWVPNWYMSKVKHVDPDIVHLHWITNGFVQIGQFPEFNKPIIWTMHDMWPFTGGCHYSNDCDRYLRSCGSCPQLGSTRENDLSRWTWKRKAKAWQNCDLTLVSPSQWLAECARESRLLRDCRIEVIPYGIDTQIFKPVESQAAREILNLPQGKTLILFGAVNALQDPRKGYHYLMKALKELCHDALGKEIELMVFGATRPSESTPYDFPTHYFGQVNDDFTLALLYNAADLFVLPSLQDNLPNTIIESMACGTPCAAFNIGGIPDMIDHKRNGYISLTKSSSELAEGMKYILENKERKDMLSRYARDKAEKSFSLEVISRRHMDLYRRVLRQAS